MRECVAIGITTRERVPAHGAVEDALADDWGRLMRQVLPEVRWLPVPNLGAHEAVAFARGWGLDGLILSGGEDVGTSVRRDATELALLAQFRAAGRPVLAICRGFQLLWQQLGGTLEAVDDHAGVRHRLHPAGAVPMPAQVNSFHRWAAAQAPAAGQGVEVLARDDRGRPEAFRIAGEPTLALMWHPEREPVPGTEDRRLLRGLFRGEGA